MIGLDPDLPYFWQVVDDDGSAEAMRLDNVEIWFRIGGEVRYLGLASDVAAGIPPEQQKPFPSRFQEDV